MLAAALLVLFVLIWQGVASLHSVDDLTLASPVETFQALRDDWSLLMDNARVIASSAPKGSSSSSTGRPCRSVRRKATR